MDCNCTMYTRSTLCYSKIRINIIRKLSTDSDVIEMFKKTSSRAVRLQSRFTPRASELITAIQNKQYERAEILVRDVKVNIDGHNKYENTALTDAASRGDNEGINVLYKLGANLHATCDCPANRTALHYASMNGHVETVKLLLKLGADPNLKDSGGNLPIHVASTPFVRAELNQVPQYLARKIINE